MRARAAFTATMTTILTLVALPAWACGFLIAENGAVRLARTTTLAAWVDGVEHYVTSFEYQGGGAAFGSIVPLPGVPTTVEKGGSWTLQRLEREVDPPEFRDEAVALSAAEDGGVEILQEVEIDALDITVLKGGGQAVFDWANEQGFDLGEGADELLTYYADRSPIFMAARFDPQRAAEFDQSSGDGTPIHLAIPTENPWVPLRILAFDKPGSEIVEADIYLLTPDRPALLPLPHDGLSLEHSAPATELLLDDLRSDENSAWVPTESYLTYLRLAEPAEELTYDLAVDVHGAAPSAVAAGLAATEVDDGEAFDRLLVRAQPEQTPTGVLVGALAVLAIGLVAFAATRRRVRTAAAGSGPDRRFALLDPEPQLGAPGAAVTREDDVLGEQVGRYR